MRILILCVAFSCLATDALAQRVLKQEPPLGSLATGKSVLVDDGTCPKGQIKKVTGGHMQRREPRSVTCVPRR
jgi:hypothetical protein